MVDIITSKERPLFQGSVRELRLDDLDSLRPILSTWIKDRDTGETLPDEVEEDLQIMGDSAQGKNDRQYFVAEDVNGKMIGVIGFKNPDPRMLDYCKTSNPAELVNAYVRVDQRAGKGVGRALITKLEEEARKKGFTEIVLNSGPRYKDTGWGFYDKLPGYQRVGVAVGYYGEGGDAPVWRKEL
ncbi:GNAT family N-acetyltransferase [Candidatus Microgenomates bacterium]|nr:GNAT family N-acetyltransferase [Candidatus Microgenomates bacterium]